MLIEVCIVCSATLIAFAGKESYFWLLAAVARCSLNFVNEKGDHFVRQLRDEMRITDRNRPIYCGSVDVAMHALSGSVHHPQPERLLKNVCFDRPMNSTVQFKRHAHIPIMDIGRKATNVIDRPSTIDRTTS